MIEHRLSTGYLPLNEILGGGFRFGDISFIYGEASTGKTTIASSSLAQYLSEDPWRKAYYIDSDNKLSTRRLTQITENSEVLERLLIWRSMTFQEQGKLIEKLPDLLPNRPVPIVVDSITGPYRLEAGDQTRTFIANKELNRQLGFLSEIAKTKDTAILITGQVHSILNRDPPEVEPVAQRLLRYWSDTILKLETTSIRGVRQAILEKPEEELSPCRFKLGETGIEGAEGW